MRTEINAGICGRRHRRLPVVFGAAVSFQTDEKQGVRETKNEKEINKHRSVTG